MTDNVPCFYKMLLMF